MAPALQNEAKILDRLRVTSVCIREYHLFPSFYDHGAFLYTVLNASRTNRLLIGVEYDARHDSIRDDVQIASFEDSLSQICRLGGGAFALRVNICHYREKLKLPWALR